MENENIVCAICGHPLKLEDDPGTDERGKPVHEDCYAKWVAERGGQM
jgi:hypothetical protein